MSNFSIIQSQSSWSFYFQVLFMGEGELTSACEFFAHNELRDSQKEMLLDSISILEENGFLIASAPTGIGKTAASLAAALKVNQRIVKKYYF